MKKWLAAAFLGAACVLAASLGAASAVGAAPGVQVTVLTTFPVGAGPAGAAATNTGDVVALAARKIVRVGPAGQQDPFPVTLLAGAFGIGPIGSAYDLHHQLYVALPGALAPPASGTPGIWKIGANGKEATPVPGSEGMVAADGMGLDAATGYLYVTDIFGGAIWRVVPPGGSAQLWTSVATNPLLVLPDGVKIFGGAAYVSIEAGKILRIPIEPDGSAGAATVWAHLDEPRAFFDDMVLDDRTGDVYVTRLDTDDLLQIKPGNVITTIASNADGLLGAANMTLVHAGQKTVIYLANGGAPFFSSNTDGEGPAIFKITIA